MIQRYLRPAMALGMAVSVSATISVPMAQAKDPAKSAQKQASKAVSSSRLIALIEADGTEMVAKYLARGDRYRLVMAAEGFVEGEKIEAFVNNVSVGILEMVYDPVEAAVGGELALLSRGGDTSEWAAGVPLNLSAGTRVSFKHLSTGEVFTAFLEAK